MNADNGDKEKVNLLPIEDKDKSTEPHPKLTPEVRQKLVAKLWPILKDRLIRKGYTFQKNKP